MFVSGSDHTRSPNGPAYGISCTRSIIAILYTNGTLGDNPPCTQNILSINTYIQHIPCTTAANGKYIKTSTI